MGRSRTWVFIIEEGQSFHRMQTGSTCEGGAIIGGEIQLWYTLPPSASMDKVKRQFTTIENDESFDYEDIGKKLASVVDYKKDRVLHVYGKVVS